MRIDADGANGHDGSGRAAYADGKNGTNPLDYLANAGKPGNWWGIVVDGKGVPIKQSATDPAPDYYISTTSYTHPDKLAADPARYLDSAVDRFIVLPRHWRAEARGVVLGCHCVIYDLRTTRSCDAVVGDFGPKDKVGEGSIALAKFFGINSDPKTGGTEDKRFRYTFYPGVVAQGYRLIPAV
jgi:hypothetical protein